AGARTLLEAVYADIVRTGNENRRPQHCYDLSLVECAAGNLATAAELVQEGLEAARDSHNTYAERELLYPLALVNAWRGRAEEARAAAARLLDEATRQGVRPLVARQRSVLGLLALSEGADADAAAELTAAVELVEEMGIVQPASFPILPDAVEALARTGDAT